MSPTRAPTRLLAAICACALACGGGCAISTSKTDYTGVYVAPETLRQIEPGESQESVLDLLGQPTRKTRLGDGAERWMWRWSKTKRSRDTVVLLSTTSQNVEESGAAFVEFQDEVVTKAWRE
ncbi:MAG: outer membrane protein assembly factor BamE [Phycisphaerales bacterium JB039]